MIKFYNHVLNSEECFEIIQEMTSLYNEKKLIYEVDYTNFGTLGKINVESTIKFLPKIEKLIEKDYGSNIVFENTFTRIHANGNFLKIHTDREELDITLSVCVYSSLDFSWPIHISNNSCAAPTSADILESQIEKFKSSYETYHTPVGTGVACFGKKYPHWRDTLICGQNQFLIQTFYHWRYE